jgi:hypothetical protein
VQTGVPVTDQSRPETAKSGADGGAISNQDGGADGCTITSLTTPCLSSGRSVEPRVAIEQFSSVVPDIASNNLSSTWNAPQLEEMPWEDQWLLVYRRLLKTGDGVVSNKLALVG